MSRMTSTDLAALEELLASAYAVVPMRDIHRSQLRTDAVIGLRHDVDDNPGSLRCATRIAAWEEEHGHRSTYFLLHTAHYWDDDLALGDAVEEIAGRGHEIGIHANAIVDALRNGGDPDAILTSALNRLRSYGVEVTGVAAHGDSLCYAGNGELRVVNDEMFTECARPEMGSPTRSVEFGHRRVVLAPRPLADFGLEYDTHRLPHGRYLSDSGGRWNEPFPGKGEGQLHVLWHPDWWVRVFSNGGGKSATLTG